MVGGGGDACRLYYFDVSRLLGLSTDVSLKKNGVD